MAKSIVLNDDKFLNSISLQGKMPFERIDADTAFTPMLCQGAITYGGNTRYGILLVVEYHEINETTIETHQFFVEYANDALKHRRKTFPENWTEWKSIVFS